MTEDNHREGEVILFPGYAELKEAVEKLRTELSVLMAEHDQLIYTECKNIEMRYMLELGSLEYKAYEAECEARRLKRKIELIQSAINRQKKPDLAQIEDQLEREFAEYQERLNEQIDKMNDALARSNSPTLSKEESRELKKCYRAIVKALHPDLHPEESPERMDLFYNAVRAYENADLRTLQIISAMIDNGELTAKSEEGMAALAHERERLEELLQSVNEKIAEIKSEYPYNLKEILQDEEKVAARKAELQMTIERWNEAIVVYRGRLEEMLR